MMPSRSSLQISSSTNWLDVQDLEQEEDAIFKNYFWIVSSIKSVTTEENAAFKIFS
jgi:hypothetical protein